MVIPVEKQHCSLFFTLFGYHLFQGDLKLLSVILDGVVVVVVLVLHLVCLSPLSYVYGSHLSGVILRPIFATVHIGHLHLALV